MCKEYKHPEYQIVDANGAVNPAAFLQHSINMEAREDWRVHTVDLKEGSALLIREKKEPNKE